MPNVSDTVLAKAIRSGDISSLYYFYGKDVATLEAYTKKLIAKLIKKEEADLNLHTFDGKNLDLSLLSDVCEAIPMFCDRICITINDLNAEDLKASDFDFLINILSGLSKETTVIIYQTGIDVLGSKKTLTGKNKKLNDLASKTGFSCEFSYKKPSELIKPIALKVANRGCSISNKSAEYLATQCLCNMLLINNEIDKLCDYSQGKEITNNEIDLLVSKQLDSNAFALAKAITQGNSVKSLELLDELYSQQVESIPILAAISMAFIDLYRARLALSENKTQADVVADFSYRGRDFAVRNAFRDASKISVSKLRFCLEILTKTDIELKSIRTEGRLLIEKAVIAMLSKR